MNDVSVCWSGNKVPYRIKKNWSKVYIDVNIVVVPKADPSTDNCDIRCTPRFRYKISRDDNTEGFTNGDEEEKKS